MRLGKQVSILKGGLVKQLYEQTGRLGKDGSVQERFRHRFELNPQCIAKLEKHCMHISGVSRGEGIAQFLELSTELHPYYIGTQSHPELTSRLEDPAPLFIGLIQAALEKQ